MTQRILTGILCGLALLSLSPVARAADCVVNKAGFVAKVQWYKPGDVWGTKDSAGNLLAFRKDQNTMPVKDENIAIGQKSCSADGYTVVLTVKGGVFAKIGITAGFAALAGIACVATGGGACVAVAGTAGGAAAKGVSLLPDPKELFFVGPLPTGMEAYMTNSVFDAKVTLADPAAWDRVCTKDNQGYSCYQGSKKGTCGLTLGIGDCKVN